MPGHGPARRASGGRAGASGMSAVPSVAGRDIAEMLAPHGARRQRLDGFDADYADIVDYIIRCTHRIWEQKDVGLIDTHYADDCVMHLMTGPLEGKARVTANTLATLAAFPDRTLVGEAVIWSHDPGGAFLTSHRITSGGTNLGASEFGPATGRRVQFTTVADCLCIDNRIVEEWLVRDNSALVLALGLSPRAIARDQAVADRARDPAVAGWRVDAMERVASGRVTAFPTAALPDPATEPAAFVHALFDHVWNHRRFTRLRDACSPAIHWHGPGGRRLFGHGEVIGWATAFIASFGDARFAIDHVASIPFDGGSDIAVRWSMAGHHDGHALYGGATGRAVYVLAVTHWRIVAGQIVHDVTIFDEVALLRQIEGGS